MLGWLWFLYEYTCINKQNRAVIWWKIFLTIKVWRYTSCFPLAAQTLHTGSLFEKDRSRLNYLCWIFLLGLKKNIHEFFFFKYLPNCRVCLSANGMWTFIMSWHIMLILQAERIKILKRPQISVTWWEKEQESCKQR